MTSRGVVLLALVLLGCHHVRPPGETGFHDSSSRDSRRGDTGLVGEGDDYYPLGTGWSWSYDTADGGAEHRVTMGATTFEGVDCWGVSEWNSNATGGISDSSTVYYMDDVSGVSLLGTEHADSSDPTATDVLVYDPPMLFVPADPAATPQFSTVGSVHLTVTRSDGAVLQDSTIEWSIAGSAAAGSIDTPAGSFDGFRITYTPGASLGFAGGVGLVDEGGGRLLSSYERGM